MKVNYITISSYVGNPETREHVDKLLNMIQEGYEILSVAGCSDGVHYILKKEGSSIPAKVKIDPDLESKT